jgi:hypothetical protein
LAVQLAGGWQVGVGVPAQIVVQHSAPSAHEVPLSLHGVAHWSVPASQ